MGMFDSVNFKIKCSEFGNVIDDFQSKDGDCLLNTLELPHRSRKVRVVRTRRLNIGVQ